MAEPFSIYALLRSYSLQLEDIARLSECTVNEVTAALDPLRYTHIPLFRVARIREVIEQQLQQLGWDPAGIDLWREFDSLDESAGDKQEDGNA
ncbi:MAG: hypothetical protein U5P41_01810 [Gammaproteobacteria bacterium]|nr:hypothetical protein [Gammaproteobacteria bacterium]